MIIRNASVDDIDGLVNIEKSCFSEPWSYRSFLDSINSNSTDWKFFLCEKNSCILGYIGFYSVQNEADISNIAVLPEARNTGIGKSLLEKTINYCSENNILSIVLEVRKSNTPAINLYHKYGFTDTGISKNHYSSPREDAILMTKQLRG